MSFDDIRSSLLQLNRSGLLHDKVYWGTVDEVLDWSFTVYWLSVTILGPMWVMAATSFVLRHRCRNWACFLLLGQATSSLVLAVVNAHSIQSGYVDFDEGSSFWCLQQTRVVSTLYMVAHWMSYLLLFDKSNGLIERLFIDRELHPMAKAHLQTVKIGCWCVPVSLAGMYTFQGIVVHESCTTIVPPAMSVLMTVADTGLSIGFVLLTAFPLMQFRKHFDDAHVHHLTSRIMKAVFQTTLISAATTFAAMLVATYPSVARVSDPRDYLIWKLAFGWAICVDLIVCMVCTMRITSSWKPKGAPMATGSRVAPTDKNTKAATPHKHTSSTSKSETKAKAVPPVALVRTISRAMSRKTVPDQGSQGGISEMIGDP